MLLDNLDQMLIAKFLHRVADRDTADAAVLGRELVLGWQAYACGQASLR